MFNFEPDKKQKNIYTPSRPSIKKCWFKIVGDEVVTFLRGFAGLLIWVGKLKSLMNITS